MNITKFYRQTAVYWGNPQPDGQGGNTFDAPVELSVRWEDGFKKIVDAKGVEIISTAMVYVPIDLNIGGWLWLGELVDISSGQQPQETEGAKEVRVFTKFPNLRARVFQRKAWL